jgi:O-antigen/teichoic acid export membrane protein
LPLRNLFYKLKAFIKAEKAFFKNVSFVFTGKVYVAILSLVLTPIIARLFTPENYGEFAIYNTVAQNLVIVSTLSLPLAVSTVKKEDLEKVFNLTVTVILYFTALFTLGLSTLYPYLDTFFSTTIFSKYWYLLSIVIASSSLITTLASLNIRLKKFKINTSVNVSESTSAKFLNLLWGWLNFESLGLILSDALSKGISFIILILKLPKLIKFKLLSFRETKKILYQHKEFPLFSLPSTWLGTISNQFIILTVAFIYSKQTLGQLSMAIGLLNLPLNLLSNSLQPVITERLVALRDGEKSHRFYEKMLVLLITISTFCFLTIYLIPSRFYTLFLGEKWEGIDAIIGIYSWYYIILFIDQAFQNGFIILNKQKNKLIFNTIDILLLLIIGYIALYINATFMNLLTAFIISKVAVSTCRVFYLWEIFKKENE